MNPKEFVDQYCIKSLVCCFSGGKDSLVATYYVISELEDIEIDKYVVFVDTTVMLPIAEPFVKDVCSQFGWNLKVLRPKESFWEQAEVKGMPYVHRRWCCYGLKLQPIFDFVRELKPQKGEVVGLRRDESLRRSQMKLPPVHYDKRRGINAWFYAPIWDWTGKNILSYIKKHELPMPPWYRLGLKETCMCGAFSSKKEVEILRAQFPELFKKFVELEGKFRSDWACFWAGKPVYAKDLAKQKTMGEF